MVALLMINENELCRPPQIANHWFTYGGGPSVAAVARELGEAALSFSNHPRSEVGPKRASRERPVPRGLPLILACFCVDHIDGADWCLWRVCVRVFVCACGGGTWPCSIQEPSLKLSRPLASHLLVAGCDAGGCEDVAGQLFHLSPTGAVGRWKAKVGWERDFIIFNLALWVEMGPIATNAPSLRAVLRLLNFQAVGAGSASVDKWLAHWLETRAAIVSPPHNGQRGSGISGPDGSSRNAADREEAAASETVRRRSAPAPSLREAAAAAAAAVARALEENGSESIGHSGGSSGDGVEPLVQLSAVSAEVLARIEVGLVSIRGLAVVNNLDTAQLASILCVCS